MSVPVFSRALVQTLCAQAEEIQFSTACSAKSAAGAAVNVHCFHKGKDGADLPLPPTTPPPEQLKPEAASLGNSDSSASLAQADTGFDPQDSGGGNEERRDLSWLPGEMQRWAARCQCR